MRGIQIRRFRRLLKRLNSPYFRADASSSHNKGMPLKKVAELFHTSYEVIRRLAKRQGVELRRSERKLTPEQLAQAYSLLRSDTPFREVAQQFGIHPESLR
jgi:transposase